MRILCPLRIFYVQDNILSGLEHVGCRVSVLEGAPVRRAQLARAVSEFRPDLVFSYAWWPGRVSPEDLAWLCERHHLPHVYWACDDPTHHHAVSLPMADTADLVFTTAEELIPCYRARGKKAAYLQHACNPELHRRIEPDGGKRHDIVLVGNNDSHLDCMRASQRVFTMRTMLEPLVSAGLDLKAFGDGWSDAGRPFHLPARCSGPPVPYRRLAAVYARAKIVLGLQAEYHWPTQSSCRPFEVLGCRAFHLAPATRAMTSLFQPGKHLMVSHSPEETLEIVRHYLGHDGERERIAAAGQLEAYRRHDHVRRAREFLAAVTELI
ncbi:MAG: glycosyltransferase [Bacteroidota bacterium]